MSSGARTPNSERLIRRNATLVALLSRPDPCLGRNAAVLEAVGLVAGFHDVAMMGQPIQQRSRHLGVAKHTRPLGEAQIGGDDHAGVLVQLGQ